YFNLKGRSSMEVLDEELPVPTKFVDFSPEDIFRAVEALKVDKYPIMELFHKIQKLYILNQPFTIINVLKEELTNNQLRQNENDVYCYILRFAAYFVLYLRELKLPIPENEGMEGDEIIKLYTELLIEYQQNKIIALYASKLPKKLSIDTYATFLKNIMESRDKRRILYILAENHGLDVKSITRATFDLIFNEPDVEDQHGLVTSLRLNDLDPPLRETTSPVSNQDSIKIRGLEWLTFNNEQVIEAFDRANALCRRFLVKGKLNAVKHVFYAISNHESPLSSFKIDEDDDKQGYEYSVINEYTFYYNMTEFFSKNEEWAKISREKLHKKETEFDTRIREATEAVEKLFEKFTNALISDNDDKEGIIGRYNIEDEERKKELNLIKDIYVPNIVLRLHHIYEKTRDGNQEYLNKSFRLANLIADGDQALYVHFLRSKKLPILIECIKNSYLEIIRTNPRDIFLY
ncbi:17050_t:CDS:10, partial [Dentiscutata erythropus]